MVWLTIIISTNKLLHKSNYEKYIRAPVADFGHLAVVWW